MKLDRPMLLVLSLMVAAPARADAPKPAEPGPWQYTTTVGLNVSQSSFTANWAGGDMGSVVWVLNSNSSAERQWTRGFNFRNTLLLAYGQTAKQSADPAHPGQRTWDSPDKTTDQLLFESVGRFTLHRAVDPYFALTAESQFEDQSNPVGTLNLNPVKLKEALGVARVLARAKDREALTRLGFGLRQTFGRSFTNPPTTQTSSFTSNDGGIEWQTTATWPMLDDKVIYKGGLLIFQALFYSKADDLKTFDAAAIASDPTREAVADFWRAPDVNFLNSWDARITKLLSVNLVAQLVYDKFDTAANVDPSLPLAVQISEIDRNVRKAGQFKETLSLALSYRLF